MNLTEKQIEEIAEELDCGMRCFYNLKTGEIKTILNLKDYEYWDDLEEEIVDEINEIENNLEDYFEFEELKSNDSFKIMEDFAEIIKDSIFQVKLIKALNNSKPFKNFKNLIDNSDFVKIGLISKKSVMFNGLKIK